MNKCCDCKKETGCKEHRGNHKYCFEPKENKDYSVKAINRKRLRQILQDGLLAYEDEIESCNSSKVVKCNIGLSDYEYEWIYSGNNFDISYKRLLKIFAELFTSYIIILCSQDYDSEQDMLAVAFNEFGMTKNEYEQIKQSIERVNKTIGN